MSPSLSHTPLLVGSFLVGRLAKRGVEAKLCCATLILAALPPSPIHLGIVCVCKCVSVYAREERADTMRSISSSLAALDTDDEPRVRAFALDVRKTE